MLSGESKLERYTARLSIGVESGRQCIDSKMKRRNSG